MFKEEKDKGFSKVETIIGPSVKVEGYFFGQVDIIVQGVVLGNLKTKGQLEVGAEARITADVEAGSANIAGEISGNLTINENLDLSSTAKIKGDIMVNVLSVEKGAQINGKISMDKNAAEKNKALNPKADSEKMN